jgi:phosphoribosylanthranilate isomerase
VVAKIKFCGMMRSQDAAAAVEAGAAYLGVVFAEGARAVSEDGAREVVAAAAGVPVLGVFVKQTTEQILRTAAASGIRGAQLHGLYSPGDAARLRAEGLEVWRVVRIANTSDLDVLESAGTGADAVLVEPLVPHVRGGAGIPLDLELARQARHRLVGPMVLAGGLRPDNVGAAIAEVHPQVVDVSSGVERRPGIKDPKQIVRFVEAVFADSSVT